MKEASGIGANLKVLIKYLDTLITLHVYYRETSICFSIQNRGTFWCRYTFGLTFFSGG